MEEFTIHESGKLGDSSVLRTLERLQRDLPDLDEMALESHLMFFKAYNALNAMLTARYTDLGISMSRFKMLLWLYNTDDNRLTVTELAAAMDTSVPNVVRMVQALEEQEWVERTADTSDRRVTVVQLTVEGMHRFKELLPNAATIWEEVWSGLSYEELEVLNHLLAKLRISLHSRFIGNELIPFKVETRRRRRSGGVR